ncbi:hypothetical protein THIOM_002957 [Candidatus Thiomargarita nelsonii]|uniref:Uncharacterized protein n=1 Tax=Candidatus Thiomargarita nelsonii TaxID=1003181 RepID=A0A176RZQ4_9GAMM|nr:hypothetical protein THIOM_002957 [Candidatus Thiomargarita nelsonii]
MHVPYWYSSDGADSVIKYCDSYHCCLVAGGLPVSIAIPMVKHWYHNNQYDCQSWLC